jgi:hypothetical protein
MGKPIAISKYNPNIISFSILENNFKKHLKRK